MFIEVKYKTDDKTENIGMFNPLHITSILKQDCTYETAIVHYYIYITTNGADDVNRVKLQYDNKTDRDKYYQSLIFDWSQALSELKGCC